MTSRQIHGRPFLSLFFCAVFLPGVALADHGAGQATKADQGKHQRHGAAISLPGGANPPSVAITVSKDPVGGWNLHVRTGNFRFAPDHASLPHIPGEGHAHLYVNGRKTARLYGPWYHIGELPAGVVPEQQI